jgi:general nucleoside transport system ATP-binding protein
MSATLELKGITKRFPGVLANDHVDLTLEKGEIHALLGENGAGKTTLMNILYGLYQPDEGDILVNGKKIEVHSPTDAIHAGVGMVHQHFMLIPVFTVTENVMLGEETVRAAGWLDRDAAAARIQQLSDSFEFNLDPRAYVKDLPVGVQQRVEIIKLLYRNADILILDEPTAVLTPHEADELFKILRSLASEGRSIIFITHKLREVMELADRITVIRRGRVVGTLTPKEATRERLAEMMVGREVSLEIDKPPATAGEPVLRVEGLVALDDRDQVAVDGVSFDVLAGEVFGVAGVQGNGQTELVQAVTGLRESLSGSITLMGRDITHASPREITEAGVGHVPEDRQRDGLVLNYSVADNLILNTYYKAPFADHMVLNRQEIQETARERIKEYDIRTPSPNVTTGTLSGGNQQKLIVAREFSRPVKLLVASQPTRGLDVGSIEFIHGQIMEKRNAGTGILLVSPELDEIMQLSDRIGVMYRGKLVAIVPGTQATKEYIGLLMAGEDPSKVEAPKVVSRKAEVTL